jgi:hypothetical protein
MLQRPGMKTQEPEKSKKHSELEDAGEVLKGLAEELRVQAHLGAMEVEQKAGPMVDEVRAAAHDIIERGKQLAARLKTLRDQQRRS